MTVRTVTAQTFPLEKRRLWGYVARCEAGWFWTLAPANLPIWASTRRVYDGTGRGGYASKPAAVAAMREAAPEFLRKVRKDLAVEFHRVATDVRAEAEKEIRRMNRDMTSAVGKA